MKTVLILAIGILCTGSVLGQSKPTLVQSVPNSEIKVNGNLESGLNMPNLSWAWKSAVACFPKTQMSGFSGKHLLYETQLPKRSTLIITLTPKSASAKMNLYGYSVGTNSNAIVPNLSSCISCESDNNQGGHANNNIRTIELRAINNPYKVYFGVAGQNGLSKGDFTITVKLVGGETSKRTQKEVPPPQKIIAIPNAKATLAGNLNKGVKIHDLSWAWNSSNACFPATQQNSFNGSHVLYETQIPPHATMEITIVPKNRNAKMSLYGYQIGTNSNYIVPNLPSCVSCEADNNQMGKATNNSRTITFTAINNPYKIVFAVVGENGLTTGDYTVEVNLKGGENKPLSEQKKVVVKTARSPEKGKSLAYKDDIKNGVFIHDLSWAWSSQNACFPETQKENYTGKHLLFETTIPKYSIMTITLIPTNKNTKLSLYGYQIGATSNAIVPKLSSCVSCEADNNQMGKATNNQRSISFTAINHPYKIMIGIAGVKGLAAGEFVIQIDIKAR